MAFMLVMFIKPNSLYTEKVWKWPGTSQWNALPLDISLLKQIFHGKKLFQWKPK